MILSSRAASTLAPLQSHMQSVKETSRIQTTGSLCREGREREREREREIGGLSVHLRLQPRLDRLNVAHLRSDQEDRRAELRPLSILAQALDQCLLSRLRNLLREVRFLRRKIGLKSPKTDYKWTENGFDDLSVHSDDFYMIVSEKRTSASCLLRVFSPVPSRN